jgi:hypothetical protein
MLVCINLNVTQLPPKALGSGADLLFFAVFFFRSGNGGGAQLSQAQQIRQL